MWSVGVIVGVGLLVHYSMYGMGTEYSIHNYTPMGLFLWYNKRWVVLSDYILLTVELIIIVNVGCM